MEEGLSGAGGGEGGRRGKQGGGGWKGGHVKVWAAVEETVSGEGWRGAEGGRREEEEEKRGKEGLAGETRGVAEREGGG